MSTWPDTRYSLLARLADADDGAAWRDFETLYQPAIYRYARSRSLQEADALEVVQEVMLAVHRAMDGWRPSNRAGSFRAWLAEAARRLTLQVLRQRDKRDRGAGGDARHGAGRGGGAARRRWPKRKTNSGGCSSVRRRASSRTSSPRPGGPSGLRRGRWVGRRGGRSGIGDDGGERVLRKVPRARSNSAASEGTGKRIAGLVVWRHCDKNTERLFLAGELSSDDEAAVIRHLDACPRCQTRLEQAAGDDSVWSVTRELLASSAERSAWTPSTSASHLSETLPHVLADDYEPRTPLVDLAFLAPTDDPAYLGRVGPYEIAGVIGQGGMGVVLKAFDRSLNRHVAIKVLSPLLAGAGAARQRFAREARAMAALSHEHVVPIYAVDEHRGLPYLVMQYIPGGTLATRLAAEGPLEVVAAVRIAMQTALALGRGPRPGTRASRHQAGEHPARAVASSACCSPTSAWPAPSDDASADAPAA